MNGSVEKLKLNTIVFSNPILLKLNSQTASEGKCPRNQRNALFGER